MSLFLLCEALWVTVVFKRCYIIYINKVEPSLKRTVGILEIMSHNYKLQIISSIITNNKDAEVPEMIRKLR